MSGLLGPWAAVAMKQSGLFGRPFKLLENDDVIVEFAGPGRPAPGLAGPHVQNQPAAGKINRKYAGLKVRMGNLRDVCEELQLPFDD